MEDISTTYDVYKTLSEALDPGIGIVEEYKGPLQNESSVMYKIRWNRNIEFVVTGWPRHMWCYVTRDNEKISNAILCHKIDERSLGIMQNMIDEVRSGKYDNKKTLSEKRLDIIRERGLTSYMNDTKWNELIDDISRIVGLPVMYRTLFDEQDPDDYWTIKGDESILPMDKALIEWFRIGCVIRKKKNNGRLIGSDVIEHDVTDDIKNILDKHSISHEYDQEVGSFTIYGYR
ncbi:hypothetical protein SAMN05216413_1864 [Ruminococcaceae bacterium KH2T8]|nr:hypothetical protein SAMN05216413_1864 [Ruminococcaceae bacterium KH2T8]